LLTFTLGRDIVSDLRTGETDVGGVYVAKATTLEGQPRQRRFVVDAPIVESDLALLDAGELAEEFEDLRVQVHDADDLDYESAGQDGFAWSQLLAVLLIGLLLGEQAFAYSASYHPRRGAA
jgi:hypothetical protein